MSNLRTVQKSVLGALVLFVLFSVSLSLAPISHAATLTNASATLANPRLSYRANTDAGTSGTSSITIDSDTAYPDFNTNHLFPGDTVCFTNAGPTGCIGNTSYTVAAVSGATTFNISSPLTANVDAAGYVMATQSGNISLTFTLVSTIPSGGDIFITIPVASAGNVNDGFPDTGTSNTTDGFDFNKLQPTSVQVTSTGGTCTDGWNTPVVASASGTIQIVKATSSCAGATVTVVVPNMVNPSPFTGSHTQGLADAYKISILTRDGDGATLDSTNTVVAPIEGVLVSATIDQSLSFQVEGVAIGQVHCGAGAETDVLSTAYSIPWGTIATANVFREAEQKLTVSTNAGSGYTVTIEENDQMGMNGGACSGATAGEANDCIKDTLCDSDACTSAITAEWNTATNNGLGYSLASGSGDASVFYYGEAARTFSARHAPDQEASQSKQNIMTSSAPVSADISYICYRISVSGTQPAGYYYNKVKYTATALF